VETGGKDGVILAHGGLAVGYALYLKNGSVAFLVRTGADNGFAEITAPPTDAATLHITATLGKDGTMSLGVNDQPPVAGKASGLISQQPQEDFCLGDDNEKPVTEGPVKGRFKGRVQNLKVLTS